VVNLSFFFPFFWHVIHGYIHERLNSLTSFSQETGEKRKGSKRALKSEKELLEFSLKYQQVLAERDAGWNEYI